MAYQNNIPQPTNALDQSQGDLLNNFIAIQSLIEVNHETFGSINEGKHKFVTFPQQPGAPTFTPGDIGLYNINYPTAAKNELFAHIQTFAGTLDVPATASIMSQINPGANIDGWTYYPSGILMYWQSISGNGLTTITVNNTFAPFNAIFAVLLSVSDPSTGDVNTAVRLVDILSPTQFRVFFSSRTATGAAAGAAKALIIGR